MHKTNAEKNEKKETKKKSRIINIGARNNSKVQAYQRAVIDGAAKELDELVKEIEQLEQN